MALGPRLDLRQTQSLVLTPQLQQAIKLLQMSNLDLTNYIEQEIERNPLLEPEDDNSSLESEQSDRNADTDHQTAPNGSDEGAGDNDTDPYGVDTPETPDTAELAIAENLSTSEMPALDTDYENVWDGLSASDGTEFDRRDDWRTPKSHAINDDILDFENLASDDIDLRRHLHGQVNVDFTDLIDRLVAAHLIELLDDAGYMIADPSAVAVSIGCDRDRVAATLDRLKRFDPPGVFAANLQECLTLQLDDRDRLDDAMKILLSNLNLLARRDFGVLRKLCGVDDETLARMVQEIKTLNPKPASIFERSVAQPVIPDVLVRRREDGSWLVELNHETLPRVLVNSRYYAVVRGRAQNRQDKDYLHQCFQSANWLVKAMQQRAQTILKVATELVRQQDEFFRKGVRYLRPLTLRAVAEVVGVHESTVSRVTNNKYLGFSRGVFEMKYFFTTALADNVGGASHSAEAIRFRIKAMINDEAPKDVLSDEKIVDILRANGVDIARRTVAKYREAMRIPSSVQRRREKSLGA